MGEIRPIEHRKGRRTAAEIRDDEAAAVRFWSALEELPPSARARILDEGDPARLAARELIDAGARDSADDADGARAARDQPARARAAASPLPQVHGRPYVAAATRAALPGPKLGPVRSQAEVDVDQRAAAVWRRRVARAGPAFADKLARETRRAAPPRDWSAIISEHGPSADPLADALARRRLRLMSGYVRGRINIVGMTPKRALEIAIAALERQDPPASAVKPASI